MSLRFEWDERKNSSNRRKHKVSFEEARDDPEHSGDEDRFVLLGVAISLRILIVCHCYRAEGDVIRIISARRATPREQAQYQESLQP